MQIDKNGDSEGNFSVLALTNVLLNNNNVNNTIVIHNFTCKYQMRQVGQFQQGEFPVSEFATFFYIHLLYSIYALFSNKFFSESA